MERDGGGEEWGDALDSWGTQGGPPSVPPFPSTFTVGPQPVSQRLSHRRPGLGAVCQKPDSLWMTGLASPCRSLSQHARGLLELPPGTHLS